MADPALIPFLAMQITRLVALATTLAGVAIVAEAWDGPWWLGAVLTLGGAFAFFFGPRKVGRLLMDRRS